MCTVSFVNNNGKTIMTSNRDEKIVRETAIEPKNYSINNKNILFPKDPKAGGTWFAVDINGTVLILLNGAKEKHIVESKYRKSRGIVVLDLISSQSPKDFWLEIELNNIEPFTIVLFQNEKLFQLRWNAFEKETLELNTNECHIWSSSTLYSKEIREMRSKWFFDFLKHKPSVSDSEMIDFHQNTENNNPKNGLVINRNNELKTVSISQVILERNKVKMKYLDLLSDKNYKNTFIVI